jgi:hypothetical protein
VGRANDRLATILGQRITDHGGQNPHHFLLNSAAASASALTLLIVPRMMWPTNGLITHQYRKNRLRDSGSVVTVRHS